MMEEIEQYKIDLGRRVIVAMDKAIESMHPMYLWQSENKCKFYICRIALDYLKYYLKSDPYVLPLGKLVNYKGYEVVEGYELEVIFVHKDYHLFNNSDMISKVKI